MPKPTTKQRIAQLEEENASLKRRIESWGGEIPENLTTRWLAEMADSKQQTRKDGTENPFKGFTSAEATVWWWENIVKPELLEAA